MHNNFCSFKPRDSIYKFKDNSLRPRINKLKCKDLKSRPKYSQDRKLLAWMLMNSQTG